MSHCCGGCGGEDPLMKKTKAEDLVIENQVTENQQVDNKEAEGQTSKKAEDESVKGGATGTWQPSGQ